MNNMNAANKLSSQDIAVVARLLATWAALSGREILGAQLGTLVSQAIRPRSVRELGGLKGLCESDLSEYVRPKGCDEFQTDIRYEILQRQVRVSPEATLPTRETEVAGADLWRFFANPGLPYKLGVRLPGVTVVAPLDVEFESEVQALPKMTSGDYKDLAQHFCERMPPDVHAAVAPTLDFENFYPYWITALRKARAANVNPLREWETVRAEHVAKRLHDALEKSGVDAATAADIVNLSRPLPKPERSMPTAQSHSPLALATVRKSDELALSASARAALPASRDEHQADDLEAMRRLIHRAVDLMSLAELRELRVSAGVLHDAMRLM